jgi:hypothetical protein
MDIETNELLVMRHFCRKYGIGQHTISRKIDQYDTVMLPDAKKPRIIDNERNRNLAEHHKTLPAHRPTLQLLTVGEFCQKYGISEEAIKRRYKSLDKVISGASVLIRETKANLRHCKIIS